MDIEANTLQALSRAEAVALLETQEVGRLIYTRRALPAVSVVNYAVRDGSILLLSGSVAAIAQAARGTVVAFEADQFDRARHTGWSVSVVGVARLVTDPGEQHRAAVEGPTPWTEIEDAHLIRIPLTEVSGRWLGAPRARRDARPLLRAGV